MSWRTVAGAGAEGGVGHQHRARGVIGETDVEELARRGCAQRRSFDHRRNLARQSERCQLMRELKTAAFGWLRRVDHQMAHGCVEIAQALRLSINDRNAERIVQPPLDCFDRGRWILAAQLSGQRFGRPVDAVDVIARIVKPVAHFLPRQAAALGGAAGQRLVDDLERVARARR